MMRLVLDDPKEQIIDIIHELILDHRISAKSIAEHLGISCELVGSIIHEDLDMRKLFAKWVPKCLNADQKHPRCRSSEYIWNFLGPIQMFSCRDWWPWKKPGYITMIRKQSNNQWSGDIVYHPAPKKSEWKHTLNNFSSRFVGIKTASSALITFQRTKLPTWSITHLFWCNWMTFWRKITARSPPRWSCSCTMRRFTGHLQPRRNWPTCASSFLITHPILRIWPRRTPTCSLD